MGFEAYSIENKPGNSYDDKHIVNHNKVHVLPYLASNEDIFNI
jgi:hypothetical protein